MVTSEQRSFLRLHGYRVGVTCRKADGHAVEYPRVRSNAFCKRYSLDVFTSSSSAWEHAWDDATQDQGIVAKWYQHLAKMAALVDPAPTIPMGDAVFQPA